MELETQTIDCPYCGETIEVQVETLPEAQSYIEDCSVCCRPIQFDATQGEGGIDLVVSRSD